VDVTAAKLAEAVKINEAGFAEQLKLLWDVKGPGWLDARFAEIEAAPRCTAETPCCERRDQYNGFGREATMPSKPEDQALATFRRSIERLQRLLDLEAPALVICQEILLAEERAWLAFGKAMDEAVGEKHRKNLRRQMLFCQDCDNRIEPGEDFCEECIQKAEDGVPNGGEPDPTLN